MPSCTIVRRGKYDILDALHLDLWDILSNVLEWFHNSTACKFAKLVSLFGFFSDITALSIGSDRSDTIYFIGENAEITARFGNCLDVRQVTWIRETDSGSHVIDTTLLKYKGTIHDTDEQLHVLSIKNCDESDIGTYFLEVSCSDRQICSNKLHLQVFKGKNLIARGVLEKIDKLVTFSK